MIRANLIILASLFCFQRLCANPPSPKAPKSNLKISGFFTQTQFKQVTIHVWDHFISEEKSLLTPHRDVTIHPKDGRFHFFVTMVSGTVIISLGVVDAFTGLEYNFLNFYLVNICSEIIFFLFENSYFHVLFSCRKLPSQ